jgi:hypothetical protein
VYAALVEDGKAADHQPASGAGFSDGGKAYKWKGWDSAPYTERLKRGYGDIVETFKELDTLAPE